MNVKDERDLFKWVSFMLKANNKLEDLIKKENKL